MRVLLLAVLAAPLAAAAAIQPGEWEFTSTTTSALLEKPEVATFRRCIRAQDAADPDRWMAQPGQQGDCRVVPGAKSANTYTWRMECPSARMTGTGTARLQATSMDGETVMSGELQGKKFELRTKVVGRRVGPCR